jgi:hypothetical protein
VACYSRPCASPNDAMVVRNTHFAYAAYSAPFSPLSVSKCAFLMKT